MFTRMSTSYGCKSTDIDLVCSHMFFCLQYAFCIYFTYASSSLRWAHGLGIGAKITIIADDIRALFLLMLGKDGAACHPLCMSQKRNTQV